MGVRIVLVLQNEKTVLKCFAHQGKVIIWYISMTDKLSQIQNKEMIFFWEVKEKNEET